MSAQVSSSRLIGGGKAKFAFVAVVAFLLGLIAGIEVAVISITPWRCATWRPRQT